MSDLRLRAARYDDPALAPLLDGLRAEYERRYGSGEQLDLVPAEDFAPPGGAFVVVEDGGRVVAGGGLRRLDSDPAAGELKRMWTDPAHRRRGPARRVLAALEAAARAAGDDRLVLESGTAQPEALALYERAGYTPVAPYGRYADEPGTRSLGRPLRRP